jgi:hypothetical protein
MAINDNPSTNEPAKDKPAANRTGDGNSSINFQDAVESPKDTSVLGYFKGGFHAVTNIIGGVYEAATTKSTVEDYKGTMAILSNPLGTVKQIGQNVATRWNSGDTEARGEIITTGLMLGAGVALGARGMIAKAPGSTLEAATAQVEAKTVRIGEMLASAEPATAASANLADINALNGLPNSLGRFGDLSKFERPPTTATGLSADANRVTTSITGTDVKLPELKAAASQGEHNLLELIPPGSQDGHLVGVAPQFHPLVPALEGSALEVPELMLDAEFEASAIEGGFTPNTTAKPNTKKTGNRENLPIDVAPDARTAGSSQLANKSAHELPTAAARESLPIRENLPIDVAPDTRTAGSSQLANKLAHEPLHELPHELPHEPLHELPTAATHEPLQLPPQQVEPIKVEPIKIDPAMTSIASRESQNAAGRLTEAITEMQRKFTQSMNTVREGVATKEAVESLGNARTAVDHDTISGAMRETEGTKAFRQQFTDLARSIEEYLQPANREAGGAVGANQPVNRFESLHQQFVNLERTTANLTPEELPAATRQGIRNLHQSVSTVAATEARSEATVAQQALHEKFTDSGLGDNPQASKFKTLAEKVSESTNQAELRHAYKELLQTEQALLKEVPASNAGALQTEMRKVMQTSETAGLRNSQLNITQVGSDLSESSAAARTNARSGVDGQKVVLKEKAVTNTTDGQVSTQLHVNDNFQVSEVSAATGTSDIQGSAIRNSHLGGGSEYLPSRSEMLMPQAQARQLDHAVAALRMEREIPSIGTVRDLQNETNNFRAQLQHFTTVPQATGEDLQAFKQSFENLTLRAEKAGVPAEQLTSLRKTFDASVEGMNARQVSGLARAENTVVTAASQRIAGHVAESSMAGDVAEGRVVQPTTARITPVAAAEDATITPAQRAVMDNDWRQEAKTARTSLEPAQSRIAKALSEGDLAVDRTFAENVQQDFRKLDNLFTQYETKPSLRTYSAARDQLLAVEKNIATAATDGRIIPSVRTTLEESTNQFRRSFTAMATKNTEMETAFARQATEPEFARPVTQVARDFEPTFARQATQVAGDLESAATVQRTAAIMPTGIVDEDVLATQRARLLERMNTATSARELQENVRQLRVIAADGERAKPQAATVVPGAEQAAPKAPLSAADLERHVQVAREKFAVDRLAEAANSKALLPKELQMPADKVLYSGNAKEYAKNLTAFGKQLDEMVKASVKSGTAMSQEVVHEAQTFIKRVQEAMIGRGMAELSNSRFPALQESLFFNPGKSTWLVHRLPAAVATLTGGVAIIANEPVLWKPVPSAPVSTIVADKSSGNTLDQARARQAAETEVSGKVAATQPQQASIEERPAGTVTGDGQLVQSAYTLPTAPSEQAVFRADYRDKGKIDLSVAPQSGSPTWVIEAYNKAHFGGLNVDYRFQYAGVNDARPELPPMAARWNPPTDAFASSGDKLVRVTNVRLGAGSRIAQIESTSLTRGGRPPTSPGQAAIRGSMLPGAAGVTAGQTHLSGFLRAQAAEAMEQGTADTAPGGLNGKPPTSYTAQTLSVAANDPKATAGTVTDPDKNPERPSLTNV